MEPRKGLGSSRRAEYAQATREAIFGAAGELFAERGFFDTKVEDIARSARVAPATVYAVGGGKSGLLRELIETAVHSQENAAIHARIDAARSPEDLIRFIIGATQAKFKNWSGLMRQVLAAAPQEPSVREGLKAAEASMREGFAHTARALAERGALRADLDVRGATDVLWYFLGNTSYFTLSDDLAWSQRRTADWLYEMLTHSLLARAGEAD